MELRGRTIALYGRFRGGARAELGAGIAARGGRIAGRGGPRPHALVVGARSYAELASGALSARLADAAAQGLPVVGEALFAGWLRGVMPAAATVPLSPLLARHGVTLEHARVLAAFDLIALDGGACRFGDAAVLRAAGALLGAGHALACAVRELQALRDRAPAGRRTLDLDGGGRAVLRWDEGTTTLDGQGLLPLRDLEAADPFERAALAEASGDDLEAARLYEQAAMADRRDPAALFNLGNVRLRLGAAAEAALAYQRALARAPGFVQARYNLAVALEAAGRAAQAEPELERVLAEDPRHADAAFNLAQLALQRNDCAGAKALFERYLALSPPSDWAARARRAIAFCAARLAAS